MRVEQTKVTALDRRRASGFRRQEADRLSAGRRQALSGDAGVPAVARRYRHARLARRGNQDCQV